MSFPQINIIDKKRINSTGDNKIWAATSGNAIFHNNVSQEYGEKHYLSWLNPLTITKSVKYANASQKRRYF